MKSVNLTENLRFRIRNQLLDDAMKLRRKRLDRDREQLGDAIYRDLYTERMLALMAELPPGSFDMCNSIGAQFEGDCTSWYTRFPLSMSRPVLFRHRGCAVVYPAEHTFAATFHRLQRREDALTEDRRQLANKVGAILKSVRTTKQLLAFVPEWEAAVRAVLPVDRDNMKLPDVDRRELNRELGLTV